MKTLIALITVSGILVAPQITKTSLTWVDGAVASSSTETFKSNDLVNSTGCMIPIKLISKNEIFLEDKFPFTKFYLTQEC